MSPEIKAPEVNPEHPWLGLLPYKEEHREFFFGRDREIEEILGRIRDNSLTILYGQSGLGKSSLLAAGVVPRLREAGFTPTVIRLNYDETAVWHYPLLDQLVNAIVGAESSSPIENWSQNRNFPHTLWEHFHLRNHSSSAKLVLIFDQFEEIFTLGCQPQFEVQVASWLEQIADLLQNRPPHNLAERIKQDQAFADQICFGDAPVRIVFALREEYLSTLEAWKSQLPLIMQNRMALNLLTGPQARQAILGPAQLGGHSLVNRDVADSIVRRAAAVTGDTPLANIRAVPPFLSLLCEQLNAARFDIYGVVAHAQITAEMVKGDSDDILRNFYNRTFDGLVESNAAFVRAWVEDSFITQTDPPYRNTLIRSEAEGQLSRAGVNDPRETIETFIQRRLISAETRDKVQRLEITHDVLIPLLVRSRKEREDIETKKHADLVATSAKIERERLANERRWLLLVTFAMTSLAMIAFGLAIYGRYQTRVARTAEATAIEAHKQADDAAIRWRKADVELIAQKEKALEAEKRENESRRRETETNLKLEQEKISNRITQNSEQLSRLQAEQGRKQLEFATEVVMNVLSANEAAPKSSTQVIEQTFDWFERYLESLGDHEDRSRLRFAIYKRKAELLVPTDKASAMEAYGIALAGRVVTSSIVRPARTGEKPGLLGLVEVDEPTDEWLEAELALARLEADSKPKDSAKKIDLVLKELDLADRWMEPARTRVSGASSPVSSPTSQNQVADQRVIDLVRSARRTIADLSDLTSPEINEARSKLSRIESDIRIFWPPASGPTIPPLPSTIQSRSQTIPLLPSTIPTIPQFPAGSTPTRPNELPRGPERPNFPPTRIPRLPQQ